MCLLLMLLLFPNLTAHNDLLKLGCVCRNCVADSEGNTNQDIWILGFHRAARTCQAGSHLSLKDKTDDIGVYLMSLEDVCLVYNLQTPNITKVASFKRPKEKSN